MLRISFNSIVRSISGSNNSILRMASSSSQVTQENQNQLMRNSNNKTVKNEKRKGDFSNVEVFANLFRKSKFVQLGDFNGRILIGEIVHRVADDIYIDMGLKFNSVCQVPHVNNEKYVVGAHVTVRLHDPELSERFLGSELDLTLLEADATLLGLYQPRVTKRSTNVQ